MSECNFKQRLTAANLLLAYIVYLYTLGYKIKESLIPIKNKINETIIDASTQYEYYFARVCLMCEYYLFRSCSNESH